MMLLRIANELAWPGTTSECLAIHCLSLTRFGPRMFSPYNYGFNAVFFLCLMVDLSISSLFFAISTLQFHDISAGFLHGGCMSCFPLLSICMGTGVYVGEESR